MFNYLKTHDQIERIIFIGNAFAIRQLKYRPGMPIGFSGNPWKILGLYLPSFQGPVQGPLCQGNP